MEKIRLAVVGLNMGRNHCMVFHASPHFELVGVCDIDEERVRWVQENVCDCPGFADYGEMLSSAHPDAVIVATPTALHHEMVVQAVSAGVKGVYCEKPMAVSLEQAEAMVALCDARGVRLMVGHQRRVTPIYNTMKRMIDEGAIGDVYLVRITCAGDFLSDGTHSVDSVRYFMDDEMPEWLLASMFRFPLGTPLWGDHRFTGDRYGHAVDSGAQVTMHFPGGKRAEILTGALWFPGRGYQDVEIFGTKGRLWRAGDDAKHDILIQDEQPGGFRAVQADRPEAMVELDGGGHGANLGERLIVAEGFWRMIANGEPHPMDGHSALKDQEIVMAAYESARIHDRILFPLLQKQYPMDLMLQNGDMA